jgi:hypothetical protein
VTSLFVAAEQREARERERQRAEAADIEVRQLLVRVDERLAAIEAKLGRGA